MVRINSMAGDGRTTFGTCGAGVNQFDGPASMFVGPAQNLYGSPQNPIYVADMHNNQIVRFNSDRTGAGWTNYYNTPAPRSSVLHGVQDVALGRNGQIYM